MPKLIGRTQPGRPRQPARAGAESAPVATRRRGSSLEDALLTAAWDELMEVGYANLTMEAVAARAGTSKPVLYRRWPHRAELVIAALRARVDPITSEVPDTGDLREDILTLLQRLRDRQQVMGPDVVRGLLAEMSDVPRAVFDVVPGIMMTILERAADRGQVRRDRITPMVAALPGTLLRHQIMISRDRVPDGFLTQVVEEIFLPLVCPDGTASY
jgi:AcrR family transcriptional regulator